MRKYRQAVNEMASVRSSSLKKQKKKKTNSVLVE